MHPLPPLTKVSDATLSVSLDQDVAALQVPMGDGWLALGAEDLCVEVHQPACYRQTHLQAALRVQGAVLQHVVQRAQLVEVGDEPQLGAGVL